MKSLRLIAALLLAPASTIASASDAATPPELRGILVTGKDLRFALAASGGESSWAGIGDSVAGWKLVEYLAPDEALVLGCDARRVTVRLKTATVGQSGEAATQATAAAVAEADALLGKMKFEAMWDRIVVEQKKAMVGGIRQQATAELKKAGLPQEEIEPLLEKMGDVLMTGMQSDAMRKDFARIYSEVYTKEELRGMADFHDTAAGKAWAEKQPEVQQKLMQAMMPRIMESMPAAQNVAVEYMKKRAAKP